MESKAYRAFFFALVSVWLAAYAATAGEVPQGTRSCGSTWKNVFYSARFDQGRVEMGRAPGASDDWHGVSVRILTKAGGCAASCSAVGMTSFGGQPSSVDFICSDPKLGQLTGHGAILWSGVESEQPTLRFGRWSEGYEDYSLKVSHDEYKVSSWQARMLATWR